MRFTLILSLLRRLSVVIIVTYMYMKTNKEIIFLLVQYKHHSNLYLGNHSYGLSRNSHCCHAILPNKEDCGSHNSLGVSHNPPQQGLCVMQFSPTRRNVCHLFVTQSPPPTGRILCHAILPNKKDCLSCNPPHQG